MKNSPASSIIMTLVHTGNFLLLSIPYFCFFGCVGMIKVCKKLYLILGSDGYQADYINVGTDTGRYQCQFNKFLDNEDSENGFSCVAG